MAAPDKKNLHFISIDKKIITCPLCIKHYHDPKLLACLHTFCKKCVQTLYDHGNQPKELECPQCREMTPMDKEAEVSKLQDNYYVRYLIKQVHDQRLEDLCETCQNTAATVRCSTCVVKLCGVCADAHMQNKEMVHELSFLLEDDVQKKELGHMEHNTSQSSRASVHSINASNSQLKTGEEKDLPFEVYCDTCKSKECEHCENMKNVAQKNMVKNTEKQQELDKASQDQTEPVPEEEDPYPEPPSQFVPVKQREPETTQETDKETTIATENDNEKHPADQNVTEGESPDGTAVSSDPVTPEDNEVTEQQMSMGSKSSLHSQHSAKESMHSGRPSLRSLGSGNISLQRSVKGENPGTEDINAERPLSQFSLRSKDSEPLTPRPEPLNDEDRQALDVSQTSHQSSPRDGSITPTPADDILVTQSVPPEQGALPGIAMDATRHMADPPVYDPRMRYDRNGLHTVLEHDMEGVEHSGDYGSSPSPDMGQARGYSPIQPFPRPMTSHQGMPKVSVSAPFGFPVMKTTYQDTLNEGGPPADGYGQVEFTHPHNWPTFDDHMSVSQDGSHLSQEDIHLTEQEAGDIKARHLKQQFDGSIQVQAASFPTQNFTIGTGTGPSGSRRKAKPNRAQSGGPKGRSGGFVNDKVKKTGVDERRAQSVGSAPVSLARKAPSPYHEKMQREHQASVERDGGKHQGNTWAHTSNAQTKRSSGQKQLNLQEPRASTPTDDKSKNGGKKQNRLGFNVQRSAPGKQAKGRVIFPELSPQTPASRKGGVNLQPMGTEYVAHSKKAPTANQVGRNLQRPKSAMYMRMNPGVSIRTNHCADDNTSMMSDDSDRVHDPVLRQMQYEDENIFEGDPVLRSMAKFHHGNTEPMTTHPYPDHDNSVSMASDNHDDDDEDKGSQISLLSNDMSKKKSKMGLNLRSTGTMSDTFIPLRFTEVVREDNDPILYEIEHTLQCITGMPAYEGFSLEELRYNDYSNFEDHTKGLLRKNYSLVYSVLQTGFKLDKLPENKVLPDGFGTPENIHTTWPFEVDTKTPSKATSIQDKASLHEAQLNTSQQSNKSNKSQRSSKSQKTTGDTQMHDANSTQGGDQSKQKIPQAEKVKPPASEAKPKKRGSKTSQGGISISEVLNGHIKSQPDSRASSRPNSKPPSRPGSRIGEAPTFGIPPSPDRGEIGADFRPITPNSARQSLPNSARTMEQSGLNRTPSPEEIFNAMHRSEERPFVTTGSHPNSPVPVPLDTTTDGGDHSKQKQGGTASKPKVIFNFDQPMKKEDKGDHCLMFGLPEMFGGLTIWEKWSLFQATKHYIPTLLLAAQEYWATRGRPQYSSQLQMGASLHRNKSQLTAVAANNLSHSGKPPAENEVNPSIVSTLDIKFEAPIICHRTRLSSGVNNQITQINCITAMKEVEEYSLDELRFGDYLNWGYVIKAKSNLCTEQVLEALLLKNAHEKMC